MILYISILTILFAGFTQGLTSFGFALISMPILVKVMPLTEAVPLVVILSFFTNTILLVQTWRHIEIKKISLLIFASLIAAPIGTFLLIYMAPNVLKLIAGFIIISFSLLLMTNHTFPIKNDRVAYFPIGFMSGLLNGSISMSGPPVALFLSNQGVSKEVFRANITAFGFILNIVTITTYFSSGLVSTTLLQHIAWLLPSMIIGTIIGARSIKYINNILFKKITLVLILSSGVLTTYGSLKALI